MDILGQHTLPISSRTMKDSQPHFPASTLDVKQSIANKGKIIPPENKHGLIGLFTFPDWCHSNINHPMLHTNHSTRRIIRQQSQHMEYKIQFQQRSLLTQLRMETCCYCGYLLYNLRQIYGGLVVGSWRFITTDLGH